MLLLKKKIKKYEILKRNNIVFKKPGSGLNEDQIQKFIGKKLNIDLKPGELIKKNFFI